MKKFNHILILSLILALCLTAAACGTGNADQSDEVLTDPPSVSQTDEVTSGSEDITEPVSEAEQTEQSVGSLSFALSADGKSYSVTGIGTYENTDIIIPGEHEGLPVKEIATKAFAGNSTLTSVSIPESVTNIGGSAFESCSSLKELKVAGADTVISDGAFVYCASLEKITLSGKIKQIATYTFHGCKALKDITYSGTKDEWAAVIKDVYWDSETGKYTVHCSDGDIEKVEVEV